MTMNYINQYHKESCERKMRHLEALAKQPRDWDKEVASARRKHAEVMEQSLRQKNLK